MQVSIDPGVLQWLLVATIGIVVAVVGVVAAIEVSRQASGSSTEADWESLLAPANRLSMTVGGVGRICDPLNLRFVLADPAVTLLRIELPNPLDRGARIAPCVKAEATPKIFMAAVEPKVIERWYNANAYWEGETKKLPIRVFLELVAGQGA